MAAVGRRPMRCGYRPSTPPASGSCAGRRSGSGSPRRSRSRPDRPRAADRLVCHDLDLDPKRSPPQQVINEVSAMKNELIDHETAARAPRYPAREARRQGIRRLPAPADRGQRLRLRRSHHDHRAPVCWLSRGRRALPPAVPAFLVDEYQDTNHAQYVLVRELVGTRRRRTVTATWSGRIINTRAAAGRARVVGDADRRSTPSGCRRSATRGVRHRLPQRPGDPLLEQNYRSTQTILSAATPSSPATRAASQAAVDRCGDGPNLGYVADRAHQGPFVARDRPAGRRRPARPVTSRSSAPMPSPGPSKRCSSRRVALQGRRRHPVLRAP